MSVIISSLLIIIVAIYLLAIVTDEYFIESLDVIANKWKLPSNVAGASLMAMGSSMPELSIALFALMQQGGAHSDVGIGNIVGSAIFNILVITGVSALVMPAAVTLRVIVRDCVVYTLSIALLIGFFLDGQITMLEALLFLGLYALYILILFQWNRLAPFDNEEDQEGDPIEMVEKERAKSGLYHRITTLISNIFRLLTGHPRRNYLRTFTVSILLIAGISWLLVEQSVLLAEALGVPPVIVALTVLAAGSSIPDLIASVLVAKEGRGEMAVANAVGSNIFDITIGLGLPWLLILLFQKDTIMVGTTGLWTSTLLLLGTVAILFVFLWTKRELSRLEGGILVFLYVIYVIWIWMGGG